MINSVVSFTDKPNQPTDVKAEPVDKNTVKLAFQLPETAYAAPINEITVEYRQKGQTRYGFTFPVLHV
jgi:hypothetical protein